MLKRLKIKFVCINMTIITCMLVLILCMVIQFTKQNTEQASVQMMEQLASNPLYLIRPTDNLRVRLPYFSLRLTPGGDFLELLTSSYDLSDGAFLNALIDISHEMSEKTGLLPEYNLRYMRISTPTDQFMIFVDATNEITTITHLTRTCIVIGFFSFFVFLGISIFLADWAVRPVDRAWAQQKQFVADASHELKTPLTVILTNVELLLSADCPEEMHTRFSENILSMTKQMKGLVEGLLELSRADNGSMKMVMKTLDFSSLIETSVCLFEPLYYENDRKLISETPPDIRLKGSEERLRQVVDILLDNALKYSLPGTPVHIRLQKQRSFCTLSVISHGESISPEDLKKIFKRFYRADKSRSCSGSYGLGLPIAESIVKEHHGKIRAESRDGENSFFVRLPL